MKNGKQVALFTYLQPLGTTGSLDRLGRVLANTDVSGVRIVVGRSLVHDGNDGWMDGWLGRWKGGGGAGREVVSNGGCSRCTGQRRKSHFWCTSHRPLRAPTFNMEQRKRRKSGSENIHRHWCMLGGGEACWLAGHPTCREIIAVEAQEPGRPATRRRHKAVTPAASGGGAHRRRWASPSSRWRPGWTSPQQRSAWSARGCSCACHSSGTCRWEGCHVTGQRSPSDNP